MSHTPNAPVTVRACANIALVKYWGKRDRTRNLPAEGSLSLTLGALTTTTTVRFDRRLEADTLRLDGLPAGDKATARLSRWLDLIRQRAGGSERVGRAEVVSHNDFPTASGLASSASAYAALAVAASRAAGLSLDPVELSRLARQGSGSAARSIHGGFVRMHRGERDDGQDCFAEAMEAPGETATSSDGSRGEPPWGAPDGPLRMVIAVIGGGVAKAHSSRDAMEHCAATSPLYAGWLASVPGDLGAAEAAIARRDLAVLGEVAEASALCMHAAAMASRPAIVYWQPATLAAMEQVRALRRSGVPAYATMDAGPHVKVLTRADVADEVARAMGRVSGVSEVILSAPGPGVAVVEQGADEGRGQAAGRGGHE